MDITVILIIVFSAVFIIGGTLVGHYATKASEMDADEINNNQKK